MQSMHSINVTPLTDVLLVLLITFLLSATSFQEPTESLPLPRVMEAREVAEATTRLPVGRDGVVLWPQAGYLRLSSEDAFRQLKADSESPILALAVHRELPYGKLYPLMMAARSAGWDRIVLLTEVAP
jgi:biopolymer transport protein TolR